MGKLAALLLIAGLALGLWLGFNPTTHKDLIKFWDRARTSPAQAQRGTAVDLRQLDSKVSIWFRTSTRFPEQGEIEWASLSFGKSNLMVQPRGDRSHDQVALWFHTSRIDELYELYKSGQGKTANASLAGESAIENREIHFFEDLYEPFYGGRQFSVRDVNGLELVFQSE